MTMSLWSISVAATLNDSISRAINVAFKHVSLATQPEIWNISKHSTRWIENWVTALNSIMTFLRRGSKSFLDKSFVPNIAAENLKFTIFRVICLIFGLEVSGFRQMQGCSLDNDGHDWVNITKRVHSLQCVYGKCGFYDRRTALRRNFSSVCFYNRAGTWTNEFSNDELWNAFCSYAKTKYKTQ